MIAADAYVAEVDRVGSGILRLRLKLADVPALGTRARGAGEGLNDMGITFSRLRVTELGGIGMLAERDCRADMLQESPMLIRLDSCPERDEKVN